MNELPTNEQILMQLVQTFLQRTELKGGEVDSYAKCFNFVQTIVEGESLVVPASLFYEGQDAIQAQLAQAKEDANQPEEEHEKLGSEEVKDISGGDNMVSEGGPVAAELEPVE